MCSVPRFTRSNAKAGVPACRQLAAAGVMACVLASLAGCEMLGATSSPDKPPPTSLLRMQRTYADLASGRFICLAHFENPDHAELLRVVDARGEVGERPQPAISLLRCRDETGSGGLYARLDDAGDELRFDGVRSQELKLIRDWRGYAVLLFSIHGPPEGVRLVFSVNSGTDVPLHWSRTVSATPGWNLYRIDLAELGVHVDLSDIRCLTWKLDGPAAPVELYLDDIILADNTAFLPGMDPPIREGALYVFEQGCRAHVGVGGRFELAFADGLIVAWHSRIDPPAPSIPPQPTSVELVDSAVQARVPPERPNLTVRSGLGPRPVPLADDWYAAGATPVAYDAAALFAQWGARVASRQRLLEASQTRVVMEGEWRYLSADVPGADQTSALDACPAHRWRYVIYPTGEVFVTVTSSAATAEWQAPRVGYALALAGRRGFRLVGGATDGADDLTWALVARDGADADLLWIPHAPRLAHHRKELVSTDEHRLVVLMGGVAADPLIETTHLLRFWPTDIDAAPEAASFAGDFQNPASLHPTAGHAVTDTPGDRDHDGYNEADGCYEVVADGGVLRFEFDPGEHVRHQPRFRVHGTGGARCWVYLDGRRINAVGRDREGRCLFVLPRVAGRPARVEVHAQPTGSAQPEGTESAASP